MSVPYLFLHTGGSLAAPLVSGCREGWASQQGLAPWQSPRLWLLSLSFSLGITELQVHPWELSLYQVLSLTSGSCKGDSCICGCLSRSVMSECLVSASLTKTRNCWKTCPYFREETKPHPLPLPGQQGEGSGVSCPGLGPALLASAKCLGVVLAKMVGGVLGARKPSVQILMPWAPSPGS